MRSLTVMLLFALPASALAQAQPLPPPVDASVADDDVIRWAAREIARLRAATRTATPPAPPSAYYTTQPRPPPTSFREPSDAARILAEAGAGLVIGALGIALGSLAVWLAEEANASADAMAVTASLAIAAGGLALTGGVTVGAELTGGRGDFGDAFLGQLVGAGLAAPLAVLAHGQGLPELALATAAIPLIGALIGYEIGHGSSAPHAIARDPDREPQPSVERGRRYGSPDGDRSGYAVSEAPAREALPPGGAANTLPVGRRSD